MCVCVMVLCIRVYMIMRIGGYELRCVCVFVNSVMVLYAYSWICMLFSFVWYGSMCTFIQIFFI